MSSGKKAKSQTYNTGGLYGSATTGNKGTYYNPTDFERQLVGASSAAIPEYMQQLINPTYDSTSYQNRLAQFNNQAQKSFENNVINPLASRGLTRGSSVNQMSNQFNNKMADAELDLMDNEDSRVSNVLGQLMNYYQIPYAMMNTINNNSQNLYAQALRNNDNNRFSNIAGTLIGGGLGAYWGGADGALTGARLGNSLF